MATGAQQQIFNVLGTMGITMGYTSIIYQPPEQLEMLDTDVSASHKNVTACDIAHFRLSPILVHMYDRL
jgi:hypothetical protein